MAHIPNKVRKERFAAGLGPYSRDTMRTPAKPAATLGALHFDDNGGHWVWAYCGSMKGNREFPGGLAPPFRFALMPVSDLDIWRAAQALIKAYGADAEFAAAVRADLANEGDTKTEAVWRSVVRAVRELQRQVPVEGQSKH
jgi:hypothetical protein